jgi:hypothetical protein
VPIVVDGWMGIGSAIHLSSPGGGGFLTFRDTNGAGLWEVTVVDYLLGGASDHTMALHYNRSGLAAGYPEWSEAVEPRFVPGAPPNGLLEKLWTYISIDRQHNFRPFNFDVDMNTNLAHTRWVVDKYRIHADGETPGEIETLYVDTAAHVVATSGRLNVGQIGTPPYRAYVTGDPIGTVMLGIAATNPADGDALVRASAKKLDGEGVEVDAPGDLHAFHCSTRVAGILQTFTQNTGAGDAAAYLLGGSAGDALVRTLAGTDWAFGCDRSTGKWTIANDFRLGFQDRLTLTTAGVLDLPLAGSALHIEGQKVLGPRVTGVAVTAEAIHAALVTQGVIGA